MKAIFESNGDGTGSDGLTVTPYGDRYVEFEIDNPWYGSTEQGFGARLQVNLSPEQVRNLHEALGKYLAKQV